MSLDALSKNERLTLWALVRYPGYNDRRLSQEIKLKMSTVTAIRNRMKREGYFKTIRMPYLEGLGCELLVVSYFRLNLLKPGDEILRVVREVINGTEDIFYAICDPFQLWTVSYCRNYTDAWSDGEKVHQMLSEKGVLGGRTERNNTTIFPVAQTKQFNLFNFSKILGKLFSQREPEPAVNLKFDKPAYRHLSRIEKKVYYGLIRFPDTVDNGIAKKIGVTRQSVTKIRKRLENEGLIATLRVPDFQKLDYEILALAYFEFATTTTLLSRKKGVEYVLKELPTFFHLTGNRDGLIAGLSRNFQEVQKMTYETVKFYMEKGFFKDEPRIVYISIKDMTVIKDFTFSPLVKKVLEIEGD